MQKQPSRLEAWLMLIVAFVIVAIAIYLAFQRTYGCMEVLHIDFWKCYAITHPPR